MDWYSPALSPYRLRTVRVGIQMTLMTLVVLGLFALLPHSRVNHPAAYVFFIGVAGLGVAVVAVAPWKRLFETRHGIACLYLWSCLDILLVSFGIAITGGGSSQLFLLYALTTVFFAASYPPRGQVALLCFTVAAYLATLGLSGGEALGVVLLRAALLALLTYITQFLSHELMVQMVAEHNATIAATQSEARFRSLVQNAADVVCVVKEDGTISYISPAVEGLLGYQPDGLLRSVVFAGMQADDQEHVRARFAEALARPGESLPVELRLRHADGSWRWVDAVLTNLTLDPSVAGMVVNLRDTTERKAFEEKLRYEAFHDSLTGLPNRALFIQSLDRALAANLRDGTRTAVLLLDLDAFKDVNDSLGHEMGDQVLVAVAERLRELLQREGTVARLGGDEFTVLIPDAGGEEGAVDLARRIAQALEAPLRLGGYESTHSASVGIALSAPGDRSATDLLRRADLAMYQAKEQGRAAWVVFDDDMGRRADERLETERALRAAVERGEIEVYYQPIVTLPGGEARGVEALARWRHPRRGLVPPAEFIPIAEETGLILPLGRRVLEQSMRQAKSWIEAVAGFSYVSVNVSAHQFHHPGFVDEIEGLLRAVRLEPASLQLEITESVLMDDRQGALRTLRRLKKLGVRLAIDDFGTGYSSLSYLRQYPIDILKVDKSFVEAIETEIDALALVRTVIGLAHMLNLTATAEGIERRDQLEHLEALQCDAAQGHYFAEALPAGLVAPLLGQRLLPPRAAAA